MKTSKLKELIRETIKENFDDRLKAQMGMSDEEFEDQIASRDIGPYTGGNKASDLIEKLRGDYRGMSDEELDEFSKEMILHFLDNTAAQAAAKVFFGKREL
jgi:ribosomal protein L29